MTSTSVERALTAAEGWLHSREVPESAIDRNEAGVAFDPGIAGRWIRRILDLQEPAGAWGGELVATAQALMTLRELREAAGLREQDPGIGQGLDWLQQRRGLPGAWTDGCSPERHRLGFCHHFVGGFYSPAPPEVPQTEVSLRCGVVAQTDAEGRFLASITALRCVLEWSDQPSTDSRLHLQGLRGVVRQWAQGALPGLTTAALLAAIHALLQSGDPEDGAAAARALRLIAGRQRGDGSWVGADPFQALEVFLEAEARGISPERCHRALWHGARLLISTQKADGSWGEAAAARRALIACRTLRRVDPAT